MKRIFRSTSISTIALFAALLLLGSANGLQAEALHASAGESSQMYKNSAGFSISVPKCWVTKNAFLDDRTEITASKDVVINPTASCHLKERDKEYPIGIAVQVQKGFSIQEAALRSKMTLQGAPGRKAAKEAYLTKEISLAHANGYASVDRIGGASDTTIRWHHQIYCEGFSLSVSGPMLSHPDPDLLAKFEAGDLAVPEPEKSMIESIKCKPPK